MALPRRTHNDHVAGAVADPLYLVALGVGAVFGLGAPSAAPGLEQAINPVLMVLLYATFLGVPLTRLGRALRDGRFLAGLLVLNFAIVRSWSTASPGSSLTTKRYCWACCWCC